MRLRGQRALTPHLQRALTSDDTAATGLSFAIAPSGGLQTNEARTHEARRQERRASAMAGVAMAVALGGLALRRIVS